VFSSGDTLLFQRFLPDYLPADGWALHYVLSQSQPNGANKLAEFDSAPLASDPTCHSINIPNFAAALDAGDYVLSAQVINAAGNAGAGIAAGEKHTVYYAELTLDPDLAAGTASAPIETFAQQMIPILQAKIKRLESYELGETDVSRSKYVIEERNKAYDRYRYWLEFRNYELKRERQRNTGQNQNTITMNVGAGW